MCHTYESSPLPDRPDLAIGNFLPSLFRVPVTIPLTDDLRRIYKYYAHQHEKRYRMLVAAKAYKSGAQKDNNDVGINNNAHRALSVGSTYLILFKVGIPKTSRHIES